MIFANRFDENRYGPNCYNISTFRKISVPFNDVYKKCIGLLKSASAKYAQHIYVTL